MIRAFRRRADAISGKFFDVLPEGGERSPIWRERKKNRGRPAGGRPRSGVYSIVVSTRSDLPAVVAAIVVVATIAIVVAITVAVAVARVHIPEPVVAMVMAGFAAVASSGRLGCTWRVAAVSNRERRVFDDWSVSSFGHVFAIEITEHFEWSGLPVFGQFNAFERARIVRRGVFHFLGGSRRMS